MHSPSIAPTLPETQARRNELFRETLLQRAQRIALGTAWTLRKPERAAHLPALARMWLGGLASPNAPLPDARQGLGAEGLAGVVGDFSSATIRAAYRRGLYPWAHVGPLKWWSPEARCVLRFNDYHLGKRVRRDMRLGKYSVTFDRDFEGVIKACAEPRKGKWHLTWITPKMMHAYAALFDEGHAHSFEVWNEAGELAGGGYGYSLGGIFHTESQFSRETNTSKIGFAMLNWHLAKWGYVLNDGKLPAPTLLEMGFKNISRDEFIGVLDAHADAGGKPGRWDVEADMKSVSEWQPEKAEASAAL
jgi:leucyl/phenylalanyl-tRNA--protein transferase